jgi:uncharacterized membrane protein
MKTTQHQRLKMTSWGIPALYIGVTLVFGLSFPRFEHRFLPQLVNTLSPSAAMAICSSISSGMIALTGIVFSLAFVMVQFSAMAYSPRLVLWVARDSVVSHALGIFSATFLYALIFMGWVDRSGSGSVPLISGMLVYALFIASMGMFIALIDRIGMLQVGRMLIFTGNRGRAAIAELYPTPATATSSPAATDYRQLTVTQTVNFAGTPQVIQAVNVPALVKLASDSGGVIEMLAAVGDTVLEGTPLLQVRGARQSVDESALRATIEIGDERTFEQDPKYALRLVVDIAIKALSPAINDPTTAVQALDQIEDLLIRLGQRQLRAGEYRDDQGVLRLVMPFPSWEDFLRLSLDEIRYCGANSVQVMRRMNALIKNLITVLPAKRHGALRDWERRLHATVSRTFQDDLEKHDASVADRQGLGISEKETA